MASDYGSNVELVLSHFNKENGLICWRLRSGLYDMKLVGKIYAWNKGNEVDVYHLSYALDSSNFNITSKYLLVHLFSFVNITWACFSCNHLTFLRKVISNTKHKISKHKKKHALAFKHILFTPLWFFSYLRINITYFAPYS